MMEKAFVAGVTHISYACINTACYLYRSITATTSEVIKPPTVITKTIPQFHFVACFATVIAFSKHTLPTSRAVPAPPIAGNFCVINESAALLTLILVYNL
jgi:hypothetical protein